MKRKIEVDLTIQEIYKFGTDYMDAKNYVKAEECFLECTKFAEGVTAAMWNYLGNAQVKQNKIAESETSYKKATEFAEGVTACMWSNLGTAQVKQNKIAESETSYKKATEFAEGVNAYMWNNLGTAQFRQNKIAESETSYKKATEFAEGVNAYTWNNLGAVQVKQNKIAESETSFGKGVDLLNLNTEPAKKAEPVSKVNVLKNILEKACWYSLKIASEKVEGKPNEIKDFDAFIKSLDEDKTNFEKAWANLNARVAAYHSSDKDYSLLKAEASYKIVVDCHGGKVDNNELKVIRNKLNAPSLNLAAKAHIYYYVQCADRRAIVNDVYSVTDVNILQGKTALSANGLTQHASEVKGCIDTKDIAKLKEVTQGAINAFKAEIAEKLISK